VIGKTASIIQGPATQEKKKLKIMEAVHRRRAVTTRVVNYTKTGHAFINRVTVAPVEHQGTSLNPVTLMTLIHAID